MCYPFIGKTFITTPYNETFYLRNSLKSRFKSRDFATVHKHQLKQREVKGKPNKPNR